MHTNTNTDAGTKTDREIMIAIDTIIVDTQYTVKAVVTTFTHVGKRLRESNPRAHLGCEVLLER